MPYYSQVTSHNKDTICVLFYADLSVSLNLKMLDQLRCFLEELFLIFIASKKRICKYLGNFDNDLVILKIWKPTNLLQMLQRYPVRNIDGLWSLRCFVVYAIIFLIIESHG